MNQWSMMWMKWEYGLINRKDVKESEKNEKKMGLERII